MVIAVANQKGGVGKSTLTTVLANYFHLKRGDLKTIVIDADVQQTLTNLREMDLAKHEINPDKLYKLITVSSNNIKDVINDISAYDIIFIDLPGNILQKGVIEAYTFVDLFIVPMALSEVDKHGTQEFLKIINEKIKPIRDKHGLRLDIMGILNKVKLNTIEYKEFLNGNHRMNIDFINTAIPESHPVFQREASTFLPYNEEKTLEFCKKVEEEIEKEYEIK